MYPSLRLDEVISLYCRIYASVNWVSTGSGNGLLPIRRQAITWTNADLFSIRYLGTKFSEIRFKIQNISLHLKMSSAKMAAALHDGMCRVDYLQWQWE